MSENRTELLQHYLRNAIGAERELESQLQAFARETEDDDEVRSLFSTHADQTRSHHNRLTSRLGQLDSGASGTSGTGTPVLNVGPTVPQETHSIEERVLHNLLVSYTAETAECAMYEAIAALARVARDTTTENLALEIQGEERTTAEKIWHFLPSRSKIAFNMLTISELDPSVETKLADDRLIGG